MKRKYSFQVHPEARAWAPNPEMQHRLEMEFPLPVTVRLWPRSMVGQVTNKVGLQPHAFRARSIENVADVFVDPTETRESIAWLIAHELAHHELKRKYPEAKRAMDTVRPGLPVAGDAFHAYDTEEAWCDNRATAIVGKRLDRKWWRDRTRAF